jgi:uncharacterized membrane protein
MWLPLALLAAALSAVAETSRKRLMRDMDPFPATLLTAGVSTAALLPAVLWAGLPILRDGYGAALLVSGGINVVAAVLIARAYQLSYLSLVSPLTGLTPVFTLAVAAVVIGEVPTLVGLAGVLTVVGGTYLLATGRGGRGATGPLRALWNDRGARMMLLVAFLYGTSSTYDKVGVLASAPIFWSFSLQAVTALVTGARVIGSEKGRGGLRSLDRRLWALGALSGVASAAMLVSQMTAMTLGLAGYVIAVKRVSILLTVLAGGLLFRERRMVTRMVAAGVILVGLVLLAVG